MAEDLTSSPAFTRTRPVAPIVRQHQRFLLRELHFTQQFAALYYARLSSLRDRALAALRAGPTCGSLPKFETRVLELTIGTPSVVAGTLFKQMKAYTRFLDDYQKELVRIDAGDDDGADDEAIALEDDLVRADTAVTTAGEGLANNLCSEKDLLLLEDESGRIELCGNINAHQFVTGLVVAIYGKLMEKGKFDVSSVALCGPLEPSPRWPLKTTTTAEPRYIAFVSGLRIGFQGQTSANIDLLLDYLLGNLGDDASVAQSACITRLVIGGDSIDLTEELKLKSKVKLDPTDHVRVTDNREKNTSANSMRELDSVLAMLADAVEVELMPGELDPSNAFLPQQPLHPILLRNAAKKSTLRLVTNPFEFSVPDFEATVFVSSGQNVTDVEKQTRLATVAQRMELIHSCGCACPTAPNTLVCYPFKSSDPFLFTSPVNLFVACNQTTYESTWSNGCRYVSVPSFAASATLVLVDLNSPTLSTTSLSFA